MTHCAYCGRSLEGRRAHARACSGTCRAELSRVERLLAGDHVDGYTCLLDWRAAARLHDRTSGQAAPTPLPHGESAHTPGESAQDPSRHQGVATE